MPSMPDAITMPENDLWNGICGVQFPPPRLRMSGEYHQQDALSVNKSLDFPQHFEQAVKRRWLSEDHLLHVAIVLLQL